MAPTTLPAGFVAIHDRKKPGDYRVIAAKDFDASVDVLFGDPPTSDHPAQAPLGTPAAPVGEADQAGGVASKADSPPAVAPHLTTGWRRPRAAAKKK